MNLRIFSHEKFSKISNVENIFKFIVMAFLTIAIAILCLGALINWYLQDLIRIDSFDPQCVVAGKTSEVFLNGHIADKLEFTQLFFVPRNEFAARSSSWNLGWSSKKMDQMDPQLFLFVTPVNNVIFPRFDKPGDYFLCKYIGEYISCSHQFLRVKQL